MSSPRILIEPRFSLECRVIHWRALELPAQPSYLLLHFLSSKMEGIAAGASLLANPNQLIRLPPSHGRSEVLLVRLAPALLVEMAARLRLHYTGASLIFRQSLTPLTEDLKLREVLNAMYGEITAGAAGWREVVGSLINQLAIYLLRAHINVRRSDEIELSRVGIVDRRLRRAIEFMYDHCERELSLAEIAAAAYLSAFHFAHLFKKLTGTTPHAYLASLRVDRARRLLAETDLSITEIGARVGYASQSHFTKVFREATGLTPRAFRTAALRFQRSNLSEADLIDQP